MPTIFDAAKYFLDKLGPMTTWKLQKLCYYAQAWSLVWDGNELFPEEFAAWTDGPASPELFRRHKGIYIIHPYNLFDGNPKAFNQAQIITLEKVSKEYGSKDADQLRKQTHSEDPWKCARGNLTAEDRGDAVITKRAISLYYGGYLSDAVVAAASKRIMAKNGECYRKLAQ
jgi:uncharacterized phage-associated protein